MGLASYHKKRNFKSTPEPAGRERPAGRRGPLRFVVQLHDASRKHYDVRLELDGTMKSWAVPKGPSLDPLERRLAVAVEDHPIEYNDFEGIIPAGNYGAGVVMIWDEGTYTARAIDPPAKDEADALRRGLAKGHLTVVLDGTKLKGEFALIRLAKGGAENWLLVKKHDRFASRDDVTHSDRSARSGRTLGEIAATAGREGRVWSTKPKESTPAKPKKAKTARTAKTATKRSAARKDLPARFRRRGTAEDRPTPGRVTAWLPAAGAPTDVDFIHQPLFDGYRAQLVVDADGHVTLGGKAGTPLTRRFPDLVGALATLRGPLRLDGLVVAVDEHGEPRRRGRRPTGGVARYAFYAYDLLHADGRDLSALPLADRLTALRELALVNPSLVLVAPAKPPLTAEDAAIGGLARPAADPATSTRGRTYRLGGGLGTTRDRADVETVAVVQTPRLPGSRHSVVGRAGAPSASPQLSLTNLGKVFWPDEGLTKGDLIDYYRRVAPVMVPHLAGRPESLHRHPNGIKAQSFFQKEVAGHLPGWMETATIASGRSGKSVTYALIQSDADLLCLANMGCIEINPWLSRVPTVNQPDFVVFDLDPGAQVTFATVIDTARTIKRLLDAIGAPAFCKTSGGRGLHVYVPIKDAASFDDARHFAEQLSREVHRQLPDTTSLERSPARRTQAVYLDYLQNRVGQTTAAVYSVRPRPLATVSTPLRWSEVRHGLDPTAFTLATVPKRLARLGDLWQGLAAAAVPLARCQEALDDLLRD